jgi:hypothetical protein
MPVHDWTKVDAGIFHDFHNEWIVAIKHALNRALSGTDYYALAEQVAGGLQHDVLTLQRPGGAAASEERGNGRAAAGVALADAPPKMEFRIKNVPLWYASKKKKSVVIRHVSEHRVVAVLEILSPGNKAAQFAIASLLQKVWELLTRGIHLSLVDLFPPTPRDPQGIHPLVWGEDGDVPFRFDPARPLTCAAYVGGAPAEAMVQPLAVGDKLPDLPLFLTPDHYVPVPLETTCQTAFENVPDFWREKLSAARADASKRGTKPKAGNGRSRRQ